MCVFMCVCMYVCMYVRVCVCIFKSDMTKDYGLLKLTFTAIIHDMHFILAICQYSKTIESITMLSQWPLAKNCPIRDI